MIRLVGPGRSSARLLPFGVREVDEEAEGEQTEEPPLDAVEEARATAEVRRVGELRARVDRRLLLAEVCALPCNS